MGSTLCRKRKMGQTDSKPSNASAMAQVDSLIHSSCVVIFSKTTCSYCNMAKRVFEDIGVPFTAIELNRMENGSELHKAIANITGANTVPRVFINGVCIGGGNETRQLHKRGLLLPLLESCSI